MCGLGWGVVVEDGWEFFVDTSGGVLGVGDRVAVMRSGRQGFLAEWARLQKREEERMEGGRGQMYDLCTPIKHYNWPNVHLFVIHIAPCM